MRKKNVLAGLVIVGVFLLIPSAALAQPGSTFKVMVVPLECSLDTVALGNTTQQQLTPNSCIGFTFGQPNTPAGTLPNTEIPPDVTSPLTPRGDTRPIAPDQRSREDTPDDIIRDDEQSRVEPRKEEARPALLGGKEEGGLAVLAAVIATVITGGLYAAESGALASVVSRVDWPWRK